MSRIRPPFVALGLLVLAWIVARGVGAERLVAWPWAWLGALAIAAGIGLIAWAIRLFQRVGTTHHPGEEPTVLVVTGPYRRTRNPMYIGLTAILSGIGLLAGAWPFLLAPIAFLLLMNAFRVPHEERALAEAFGADFEAYRRRVRRWL